jgi:hypothetical protein
MPSYRIAIVASERRDGRARPQDDRPDVRLSTPKELDCTVGEAVNPQKMFAARFSPASSAAEGRGPAGQGEDLGRTVTVGIGPRRGASPSRPTWPSACRLVRQQSKS